MGPDAQRFAVPRDSRPTAEPVRSQPILEMLNITHRFGDVVALDDVTVRAAAGEFLTILGESGSGKTTLLRIISGLERPSDVGAIKIAGKDVAHLSAAVRNCTTVFQHYALFPHMSVGENVEYGLKVRGVPLSERRQQAEEALALVRLGDKYGRRIHQLSGGERQRVALARALVTRPAILLLDEPLGALDEKLRVDMQLELLDLHKKLGLTFVYITHSQEEALTMSDRVILMRRGRIEQEGPPQELFDRPVSRFVAEFMGVENILDGIVSAADGVAVSVRHDEATLRGRWCGQGRPAVGDSVALGVRAERLRLGPEDAVPVAVVNRLPCRLEGAVYKGKYLDQTVGTAVGPLRSRLWDTELPPASVECVHWIEEHCAVMRR